MYSPYSDIRDERVRAHAKHYKSGKSMEDRHYADPLWMPVLVEEVGEVARALCDNSDLEHLREEIIQVAAMAAAWADSVDRAIRES